MDFKEDTDLLRILPGVALQVIQDINDYLKANSKDILPESTQITLKDQIAEMEDPNQRIRDLVQRRIVEFHKQAISTARSAPLQIPPGLTLCQKVRPFYFMICFISITVCLFNYYSRYLVF